MGGLHRTQPLREGVLVPDRAVLEKQLGTEIRFEDSGKNEK